MVFQHMLTIVKELLQFQGIAILRSLQLFSVILCDCLLALPLLMTQCSGININLIVNITYEVSH